jgi:hypothetical protein
VEAPGSDIVALRCDHLGVSGETEAVCNPPAYIKEEKCKVSIKGIYTTN